MIQRDGLQKKFKIFIFLSLFILLIEILGGIFTNSLALLSDAGHVLVDLAALLLAYFSIRLSQRKSTRKFTFGYYRAEILAAVINGFILILITLYIFYESYSRFLSPQSIRGPEMLVISVIGFIANLYVVLKLRHHEKSNLNVRGAYLHVLSDTLSSIGVVAAGILIMITGNYIFDSAVSIGIGIFLLVSSGRLIKESAMILMEASPDIDMERISVDIKQINGVRDVHDLHVWCISSDICSLSAHVVIHAKNIKSVNRILAGINEMLKSKYSISHTALQCECDTCADGENRHSH